MWSLDGRWHIAFTVVLKMESAVKKTEVTVSSVVAGVIIAGAADLVLHREKIRQSMRGQEHHYLTNHRGSASRFVHALASQTVTGRLASWAFQRMNPRLESDS